MIAAAKAVLIVLFFMHVFYSHRLTWVVSIASLLWLGILLALTLERLPVARLARHSGQVMATSTFMLREASRSTEFGWSIGPNFDTITRVFYHASAPPNHGWMRLRRQGAKRSMPNHDLSHRRRRPDLDVLEGRWVLSGGVTVIPTLSPPAIVLGINFNPAFPQPATHHFSMAVPAFEGFGFWPERPAGFHGGPGSWHGLVPPPGFGGPPAPAEFLQGTPVLSISPVDEVAHPALPPFTDPLFPPSMMGSLDASMPRMIQKASSDLGMPHDHGPQMRPLSGIIAENLRELHTFPRIPAPHFPRLC